MPEDTTAEHESTSGEAIDLQAGQDVAVRCRFDGSWVEGYQITEQDDREAGRFRVRRRSDERVLPTTFPASDLRSGRPDATPLAWIPDGGRR